MCAGPLYARVRCWGAQGGGTPPWRRRRRRRISQRLTRAQGSMLADRIDNEMKDAARAREAQRLNTLRMLKSAMKYREIEKGKPLEDADVVGVVGTLIKQRRDSAAQYTAGGRPELAANETAEIAILEAFLPRQLTDDELGALVQEAIAARSEERRVGKECRCAWGPSRSKTIKRHQ